MRISIQNPTRTLRGREKDVVRARISIYNSLDIIITDFGTKLYALCELCGGNTRDICSFDDADLT